MAIDDKLLDKKNGTRPKEPPFTIGSTVLDYLAHPKKVRQRIWGMYGYLIDAAATAAVATPLAAGAYLVGTKNGRRIMAGTVITAALLGAYTCNRKIINEDVLGFKPAATYATPAPQIPSTVPAYQQQPIVRPTPLPTPTYEQLQGQMKTLEQQLQQYKTAAPAAR